MAVGVDVGGGTIVAPVLRLRRLTAWHKHPHTHPQHTNAPRDGARVPQHGLVGGQHLPVRKRVRGVGGGSVKLVDRTRYVYNTRHTTYTPYMHAYMCPYKKIKWGHLLELAQAEAEGHHVLERLEAPGCLVWFVWCWGGVSGRWVDRTVYTYMRIYSRMRHTHIHIYIHTHTRYAPHHLRSSPPRSLASSTTRSIFCSAGSGSPCCGGV